MTEPSKLLEVIFTNSYAEVPCAYIRHKNSVVAFDTSKLLRGTDVALHRECFSYLNRFFFDLPAQQQDKVISAYARAETIMRTTEDMASAKNEIMEVFQDLIDVVSEKACFDWLVYKSGYAWPPASELPPTYEAAASPKYPAEKTYVLKEYQELLAMILQLRACLPIWSAYLSKFGTDISTSFRDIFLVGMLGYSDFDQGNAWRRLEVYIEAGLGNKEELLSSGVIAGISKEMYPHWLLCHCLLRKLVVQGFKSAIEGDTSPFIIKHLSNHIRDHLRKTPISFRTPSVKTPPKYGDDVSDDSRSVFENNRGKEAVARSERWTTQIYLENPTRLATAVQPDIDLEFVQQVHDWFDRDRYVPSCEQLLIAMWVVSIAISVNGEDDLTRFNSVTVCAVASAILWHRGHKEIATLVASYQGAPIHRVGAVLTSNFRLPKEDYEALARLYPIEHRNIKNGIRGVATGMIDECCKFYWETIYPKELVTQVHSIQQGPDGYVYPVTQGTALDLIAVIIDLAKRPKPESGWDKANRIAREMALPDSPQPWPVSVPPHRPL